ncbi:hypothetical protein GLOIN_2v1788963 [Rhizophagus irregularis DAOM 181602=DAOM 197198]|nr:hypothetical protein GLOIN_2v1788963 [Rhizophagus irregularis DAOM 181602=DAOM 197198]
MNEITKGSNSINQMFFSNYKEDLKESLSSLLSDSKSYKSEATLLKKQIENIKNSLSGIAKKISEYNEKITEKRKVLSNHIDTVDKITDDAKSYATRGKIVAEIGVITAAIAAPFTGGTFLVAIPVAEVVVGLSCLAFVAFVKGTERSTTVVETSSNISIILNYQLESVREIPTSDIIEKLEKGEQRMNKFIARSILAKAKKTLASSESYNLSIRQVLNRDLILTVRIF